ncbi:MAG: DUF2284 domain-containing protein [Patescibacteria group bacterium]|nr:DUF2284 domain-containing protein [Patescibacteria group bacterium]
MKTLTIKTPKHELLIDYYYGIVEKSEVAVDKVLFIQMCKDGCSNYGNKYSCPPYSPHFEDYLKNYSRLFIVAFTLELSQFNQTNYKEYLKIRIANSILKSRIEKLMRILEQNFDTKYLGTGACKLCRSCQLKIEKPCKYPSKRRYSLESLGVDCDDLMKQVFQKKLKWYRDEKAPEYTSVICALPIKNNQHQDTLESSFIAAIRKIF